MQEHRHLLKTRLSNVLRTTSAHISELKGLGVVTVDDFLHYFPRAYRDQSEMCTISEMRVDKVNVVQGVLSKMFSRRTKTGKIMTMATLTDPTGNVNVMWFNQPHIQRMFRNGDELILTGKIKFDRAQITMMSPQYEVVRKKQLHTARLVPVYHERDKISSKWIREKIHPLLKGAQLLEDCMPGEMIEAEGLMSYGQAVRTVHDPKSEEDLQGARRRLAFDELFMLQFAALKRRYEFRKKAKDLGKKIVIDEDVSQRFYKEFGYELTGAQQRVISEISGDLTSPYPMMRLLQGDVGAGKTVVAAFGLVHAINSGFQAALMAPTEILARQHYESISKLLKPFGFNIQFLMGSLPEKQKKSIARQVSTGTVDLVIGTHALIQDGIQFKNLGLAVIDEQHRFGVKQRERLQEQGSPHVLSLSATPIPRTLTLVLYGDQDVSILDELPPGRQKIITRVVPEKKRSDAELWIADHIQKGRQIFVICPLIDESDVIEVKAVTTEFERLSNDVFANFRLGLLHGKLKSQEKEEVMNLFSKGEIDILVSTSVVEVGIDVPNATIMLIEGAERFGLSQLHQFRGRVGRGEYQSYCFLFTDSYGEESRKRLKSLEQNTDGFKLAEIDLAMRGPGEVYGVKQSGIPDLKMASLGDTDLIKRVRNAAADLVMKDPDLEFHQPLKTRLKQLEDQAAIA
ncbi:ATP-dependent DNA helicase RecG [Candidatus Peregrinibacteria bacterium]|jgi:ATP-dependent DNA helicase RecG|nr:ATP-dependent DNA helicase RecG [Candidatus Peregrinibacteria bacterium]MBT7484122.1 ATP-dependent DNA helicase RecG [Candidatus Peregrinibacteria bacterium]MBT7702981.1 ATP-dependent DNA helicase RecG [Candidatus Peregrinibacteria bacterium]